MTTHKELVRRRYGLSESAIDKSGRVVTVRRMQPWDANRVRNMADSDRIGIVGDIVVAASVIAIIDGDDVKKFQPPTTPDELASVFNELDIEGIEAAAKAYFALCAAN